MIGDDGTQIGVMRTDEALRYAQERDLDLVEVAPEARPPVCRVLDYSKYKYEQSQKLKAARKHQQQITIREIKFRPKIAEQDYATKKRHVERFLKHKDKVKITIMFRGREVTHPERGQMILDRLAEELTELAIIEQRPNLDGRNMTMLLGPSKAVLSGTLGKDGEDAEGAENGEGDARAAVAAATVEDGVVEADANGAEPVAVDDAEAEARRRRPDDDAEARGRSAPPSPQRRTTPSPRRSAARAQSRRSAIASCTVSAIADRPGHAGVLERRGDRRVGRHDEPDLLSATRQALAQLEDDVDPGAVEVVDGAEVEHHRQRVGGDAGGDRGAQLGRRWTCRSRLRRRATTTRSSASKRRSASGVIAGPAYGG